MTIHATTGRRSLAARSAAFATLAATPLLQASPAMAQALKMMMGIGLTNDGAPHVFALQKEKLLDKAAAELGLTLDAEYLNFPVLLRMLQGIAAGQLDIGHHVGERDIGETFGARSLPGGGLNRHDGGVRSKN